MANVVPTNFGCGLKVGAQRKPASGSAKKNPRRVERGLRGKESGRHPPGGIPYGCGAELCCMRARSGSVVSAGADRDGRLGTLPGTARPHAVPGRVAHGPGRSSRPDPHSWGLFSWVPAPSSRLHCSPQAKGEGANSVPMGRHKGRKGPKSSCRKHLFFASTVAAKRDGGSRIAILANAAAWLRFAQAIRMTRTSMTFVWVSPVFSRSPVASKK